MGLFSSSSRSVSTQLSQGAGFSEIGGPAYNVNLNLTGGKRSSISPVINFTDQGAIAAAQAIADRSLRQVELFGGVVQRSISGAIGAAAEQSNAAIEAVAASKRSEVENIGLAALKWGALAFGVYALARIFYKGA